MKRFISLMLVLLLFLSLFPAVYADGKAETWAVYIYLCGSNLESNYSNGTYNLNELNRHCYSLPDNVTFVVEAGGTSKWHLPSLNPKCQNRFTVTNKGFGAVEQSPKADMSQPETLESFLKYATEKYPADKTMLIIWDHGGGTCNGICSDQNFEEQMMPVTELHDALTNSFNSNKKLDILAFDACLMATVDIADLFSDCVSYMVASEETVPGKGISYEGMCLSFIEHPDITPEDFGKEMLDYYVYKSKELGLDGSITLSLMDLSKAGAVADALESFGGELLKAAYSDPLVYLDLAIAANNTVNYGGNSRITGYWNLVDLATFADKAGEKYPSSEAVVKAVKDCVIYSVNGEYLNDSKGISLYYPYNADEQELERYKENGTGHALKALYEISVNNTVSEAEKAYVSSLGLDPENPPQVNTFSDLEEIRPEVTVDEKSVYSVDFGTEVGDYATNVFYELFYISPDTGSFYYIGSEDYGIETDFANGKFKVAPEGLKWMQIGDWLAVKELAYDGTTYNIYTVPVLYDGEKTLLQLVRDNTTGELTPIGACGEQDELGAAFSFMIEEGEYVSILQCEPVSDTLFSVETVEYRDDLLKVCDLEDGEYAFRFVLEDIHKDLIFSDYGYFTVKNGKIG